MVGQGPDIIFQNTLPIHDLATSGFLMDFYTLIDQDPRVSRSDFHTNVLEAFEINGGLYMFPMSFGFNFVAINADMPQHFIDRFLQKSGITLVEMLDMYNELMTNYSVEFGHLLPGIQGTPAHATGFLQTQMGNFINLNTRTSNLNDPNFIKALERMQSTFGQHEFLGHFWISGPFSPVGFLHDRAREVMFITEFWQLNLLNVHFEWENPPFVHYIPLVDYQGRLIIDNPRFQDAVWAMPLITTTGDSALAWELVLEMIHVFTNPQGRAAITPGWGVPAPWGYQSISSPIQRSLVNGHLNRVFENALAFPQTIQQIGFIGLEDDQQRALQINAAIQRISAYNEMPMVLMQPQIPLDLVFEHFELLMDGAITAEQAAQRMHNTFSLWLME